jgi:hypothetical protein
MNLHICKSWPTLLFSLIYSALCSQPDFRLIDSLIKVNQFPIASFIPKQELSGIDTNQYFEKYRLKLCGENDQIHVRYLTAKNNTVTTCCDPLQFTPLLYYSSDKERITMVPETHLAFFYTHVFRRKSEHYRYINFFIDHIIKNDNPAWNIKDYHLNLKIYDKDNKLFKSIQFPGNPLLSAESEGWVITGRNQLDYNTKVELWNHFSPTVYRYSIEVLNREHRTHEVFQEKIGFRDLRLNDDEVFINNARLSIKAAEINRNYISEDSLERCLVGIKLHNFNSVVNSTKWDKKFFDLCDSIGLNVFQKVDLSTFLSLSDLLNYFVSIKEHPSFIAWFNEGMNADWERILSRLDHSRLILTDKQIQSKIFINWHELSNNDKEVVKKRFQPFNLYFTPGTSTLKIEQSEFFKDSDKLAINWTIQKNDSTLRSGNVKYNNSRNEIKLLIDEGGYKSAGYSYEFKLIITGDSYPYRKGDVIASNRFRYTLRDGKLIYTAD